MRTPTRLLLFVLVPLAIAVAGVAWVLQRQVASGAQTRQRLLPASTQTVYSTSALAWWVQVTTSRWSSFGFVDPGTWYATTLQRGASYDLMAGDARGGRIEVGTNLRAASNGPGVAADGLLFVPTAPGDVTALDLMTCRPVWVAAAGGQVSRVAVDGGRVVARTDNRVTCFDAATGRTLWAVNATGATAGPGLAGRYACFATSDALHVVDAVTGRELRKIAATGMWDQIVIDGERAYACARPTTATKVALYAFDLGRGSLAWQCTEDAPGLAAYPPNSVDVRGPAVGDGAVVFAFTDRLCAVDAVTGQRRWLWQAPAGEDVGGGGGPPVRRLRGDGLIQTPAVHHGVVYANWANSRVSGFDLTTGREVWRYERSEADRRSRAFISRLLTPPFDPPPMAGSGMVLCVTDTGLTAISCDLVPKSATSSVTPASRAFPLFIAVGVASSLLLIAIILGVFGLWRLMTAAACLALCALTVWAWVRSYGAADFVGHEAVTRTSPFAARSRKGITSHDGSLTFGHSRQVSQTFARRAGSASPTTRMPEWRWEREPSAQTAERTREGLRRFAWTRRSRSSGVSLSPQAETSLTLPHWFVAALLGVAPMAWVTGLWRDRRRHPRGHCENCGYDLRGGVTGRCPECGWDLPPDAPTPKRRGLPSTR